jgi:hypothetical protein
MISSIVIITVTTIMIIIIITITIIIIMPQDASGGLTLVCPQSQVASRLLSNGTMGLITSALERFDHPKRHLSVQQSCLWGIDSLLFPTDHRPAGTDPRVPVPALVTLTARAMRRYPNTTAMQAGGCSVVNRLNDYLLRVPHQVREAGILSLALAAMERLPDNPELQAFCAGAVGLSLIVLAARGDDQGEEVAGAPALVVSGMRAFPADKDMQMMGCLVLGELDGRGFVPAGALGNAGAWGVVASALSRFRRDVGILGNCCIAAGKMGGRETGVVPPGVGEAVAAALAAFADDGGDGGVAREECLTAQRTLLRASLRAVPRG